MVTRRKATNEIAQPCYVSLTEPKTVKQALEDDFWIVAMQEELSQFQSNNFLELVTHPANTNVVGRKWILKNKTDEFENIIWNKAQLVAQGYNQVERIDFEETFALVAWIESIRLLLVVAYHLKFKLFQMDVKSAFLIGFLQEKSLC
ncbi:uncharacterized mitochondrial protein AtMg00820-like [Humulus lupulus]|uniref:uncharacterized mitochondrial protein AtMg00820-like n=1 Tax=Humulus lupulus TaxID=3486 RepID=UPI002B40F311|nr:uncharacterized mitochondrial protein AtMg00820-like [Humulus lupulus]